MKKIFIGIMLSALICLTGCKKSASEIELKNDKTEIKCVVGENVKVSITANPTTGYSWEIKESTGIKTIKREYKADKADSKICGSGGKEIFEIAPENKGEKTIKFVYVRSWEKGVIPTQTKTLIIHVD